MGRAMFALKVHTGGYGRSVGASGATLTNPRHRVVTSLSALYGFRFEYGQDVVAGESLTPITAARAGELRKRLRAIGADARLLENDILFLVIVSTGYVDVVSSICCCRPVYYCYQDRTFYCSTSIRSLRESGVAISADEEAFPEFLVYRYVVPPRTLYRRISKLLGGQSIRVDLADGKLVRNTYYEFHRVFDGPEPPAGRAAKLGELLSEQLSRSFQDRSNVGVLLSGGLDSGLLAAIGMKLKNDITSVSSSFGFVDNSDAETGYAMSFARHLDISHNVYSGSAMEYLSGLVESIYAAEEPVHHLQSVMLYLLFKGHAGGQYDVLACGESADGLLGNDLHSFLYQRRRVLSVVKTLGGNATCRWLVQRLKLRDYRWQLLANDYGVNVESVHHILWSLGRYGDPEFVKNHFGGDDESILSSRITLGRNYTNYPLLDQTTIVSFLCEGLVSMCIWSKLAESLGIILVYPFAATGVVDYLTSVPWPAKLHEKKYLVRALLRTFGVPEELVTRPKLSFGFPHQYWALPGALFQPIVDMSAEMFDPLVLRSLQTQEPSRAMLLWNLINLFLWRKLLIDEVAPEALSAEILERRASGP